MNQKSAPRHRVCGTPSRLGCITCKIRRVKCGEEKPFCKRCTSTGRKCDGYEPPKSPKPPTIRKPSPRSLAPSTSEDQREQSLLHFFTTATARALSGYFSPDFWERRVLQATVVEPSIRHGAIAIAALHQDFNNRQQLSPGGSADYYLQDFAFHQYTKAISHLQQSMSNATQQLDLTLISCILFISFDCILGNHPSALIHLKAGLKILEDIKMQTAQGVIAMNGWEREFAPLLLSLGVQATSVFDPTQQEDRAALCASLKNAALSTQPTKFSSLDEARHALDTVAADILTDCTFDKNQIPLNSDHGQSDSETRNAIALQAWSEALDRFLADFVTSQIAVSNARRGASMLKAQSVALSIAVSPSELAEEKHEKILAHSEFLISAKNEDLQCLDTNPTFSADKGLIAPLFFTALKAPKVSMKRRALDLLSRAPSREGLWDAEDAWGVAEGAIEYAEQNMDIDPLLVSGMENECALWNEMNSRMLGRMKVGEQPHTPTSPSNLQVSGGSSPYGRAILPRRSGSFTFEGP